MTPEQFFVFADPLPEPMVLLSGDGVILAGNQAVEDRFAIAPRALQGRQLADFVAAGAEEVAPYLRSCSRSRKMVLGSLTLLDGNGGSAACRAEGTLLRPKSDGNPAILLLRLIPKQSAIGQFVALNQRIADLAKEIQRRRHAEEAARQEQERLRVTLHSIGDAVIVTDPEGRIESMNPVAESLTGWTQAEARGRPLEAVFHIVNEATRSAVENPALRALREGLIVGLANHTLLIAKDETERPIDDSAAAIRDDQGHVIGAVLVFRDISKRRLAEAEAHEANRRKDEFLATLAHELRNPLAPIRNGLHIMRLTGNDQDAMEKIRGMMERQLGNMVRLVDDLLDVSRISRGKIALHRERIDLATVVGATLETCDSTIKEQGHELRMTLPAEPIYVDADQTRLAQALSNLLSNAAKYTEKGGRIWMDLERHGNEAVLTVRDNGIGIPAAMLPRIFDMFTQVDWSLEKSLGGLGIGLTIVKRLVEMHGGTIEAHSGGRGMGSEFVVRLPVVLSLVEQAQPASRPDPAAKAPLPRRVLVVDDNVDAASSLALMLQIMGNEVRTAHDGLEALEAAADFRPDLILLDIGMPKLNGYDACRRIREEPWGKDLLLVALTGWGQDEDRRRSQEAGFNHHLVKPVEPATMEKLLASLSAEEGAS